MTSRRGAADTTSNKTNEAEESQSEVEADVVEVAHVAEVVVVCGARVVEEGLFGEGFAVGVVGVGRDGAGDVGFVRPGRGRGPGDVGVEGGGEVGALELLDDGVAGGEERAPPTRTRLRIVGVRKADVGRGSSSVRELVDGPARRGCPVAGVGAAAGEVASVRTAALAAAARQVAVGVGRARFGRERVEEDEADARVAARHRKIPLAALVAVGLRESPALADLVPVRVAKAERLFAVEAAHVRRPFAPPPLQGLHAVPPVPPQSARAPQHQRRPRHHNERHEAHHDLAPPLLSL
eukprot:CAMPEP_0198664944 /NCGR_PEP_ID=MMETSP1467-20131203/58228_1 /TAXON_ID=1462469 /ORGANISM="unid. sp., Strain CCMP2135" /LENGTH=293 /DNA_ID=CAMNT_0044401525 /DNA_START=66 /DNA_END=948 /DNA_ORIENTATION=-